MSDERKAKVYRVVLKSAVRMDTPHGRFVKGRSRFFKESDRALAYFRRSPRDFDVADFDNLPNQRRPVRSSATRRRKREEPVVEVAAEPVIEPVPVAEPVAEEPATDEPDEDEGRSIMGAEIRYTEKYLSSSKLLKKDLKMIAEEEFGLDIGATETKPEIVEKIFAADQGD